jgi:hypothetical protein
MTCGFKQRGKVRIALNNYVKYMLYEFLVKPISAICLLKATARNCGTEMEDRLKVVPIMD